MERPLYLHEIEKQFRIHKVCAILGPRQCGKTTLAHMYAASQALPVSFFDLENPYDLAQFENPMLALENLEGLIIIDEIQRRPELFPTLRYLVDYKKQRFLILGSASPTLLHQSSETLAGRIGYIELSPFNIEEVKEIFPLWIRGGFPLSFLAPSLEDSWTWRKSYIQTYLEKEIPTLGFKIPSQHLYRFWTMLAHYHGNIFNSHELGRSLDISSHTTRKYLDILAGTFMVRVLQPSFANISKRQVKSPKIYFRDSGIFHTLLNLKSYEDIRSHPKLGASWEGFALEQIMSITQTSSHDAFFWGTQSGAELDLLILKEGKKIGFEIKYTDFPKITPSMKSAFSDLELSHLFLVYPGKAHFSLATSITTLPLNTSILQTLLEDVKF